MILFLGFVFDPRLHEQLKLFRPTAQQWITSELVVLIRSIEILNVERCKARRTYDDHFLLSTKLAHIRFSGSMSTPGLVLNTTATTRFSEDKYTRPDIEKTYTGIRDHHQI